MRTRTALGGPARRPLAESKQHNDIVPVPTSSRIEKPAEPDVQSSPVRTIRHTRTRSKQLDLELAMSAPEKKLAKTEIQEVILEVPSLGQVSSTASPRRALGSPRRRKLADSAVSLNAPSEPVAPPSPGLKSPARRQERTRILRPVSPSRISARVGSPLKQPPRRVHIAATSAPSLQPPSVVLRQPVGSSSPSKPQQQLFAVVIDTPSKSRYAAAEDELRTASDSSSTVPDDTPTKRRSMRKTTADSSTSTAQRPAKETASVGSARRTGPRHAPSVADEAAKSTSKGLRLASTGSLHSPPDFAGENDEEELSTTAADGHRDNWSPCVPYTTLNRSFSELRLTELSGGAEKSQRRGEQLEHKSPSGSPTPSASSIDSPTAAAGHRRKKSKSRLPVRSPVASPPAAAPTAPAIWSDEVDTPAAASSDGAASDEVVFFIDCETTGEDTDTSARDRYAGIVRSLGAGVVDRWTWIPERLALAGRQISAQQQNEEQARRIQQLSQPGVSHVVWFNGATRTLTKVLKARALGHDVKCLSLAWIAQCSAQQRLTVGEAGFEVDVEEELARRGHIVDGRASTKIEPTKRSSTKQSVAKSAPPASPRRGYGLVSDTSDSECGDGDVDAEMDVDTEVELEAEYDEIAACSQLMSADDVPSSPRPRSRSSSIDPITSPTPASNGPKMALFPLPAPTPVRSAVRLQSASHTYYSCDADEEEQDELVMSSDEDEDDFDMDENASPTKMVASRSSYSLHTTLSMGSHELSPSKNSGASSSSGKGKAKSQGKNGGRASGRGSKSVLLPIHNDTIGRHGVAVAVTEESMTPLEHVSLLAARRHSLKHRPSIASPLGKTAWRLPSGGFA